MSDSRIAFLGTGLLGAAFVEAALGRGDRVTVWNRTTDKARALERFGATVASSPADAVRGAERVHLVLTDDDVVEDVITALRPGLASDAIIVDHTTTQPQRTAERAQRLTTAGVQYLHCPVFIGPPAARRGLGIILAAGPRALFDRVEPALARMAEQVRYVGDRADVAAVHKLCGNAFFIGLSALAADVLAVARAAGVPDDDALGVIAGFDASAIVQGRGRAMSGDETAPTFELTMARKDVRLMIETARDEPLAALPGIAARMDALIAAGRGARDLTTIGMRDPA